MTEHKPKRFLIFLLFLFGVSKVYLKKIEIKCPEFCECDVFQSLRRAVCQHRSLVSIELNIPPQAQILDLSDNQISELGDKIFLQMRLTELKLLNLSYNKIQQIHFNGFEGLNDLKTLDLSFNALNYFLKTWFVSLNSLQELYLRGNKFKEINNMPLIELKNLRVLDLSKCGIAHLNTNLFTMLPSLETLDISENTIERVKVEVFKPLSHLTFLNAEDNNFICKDRNVNSVKNYMKNAGIKYKDPCLINILTSFTVNSGVQKFQKMVMAEDDLEVTTSIQPKNFWIFDTDEINNTKIIEVCSNTTIERREDDLNQRSLLMQVLKYSPWMVISITFVYGVLSGMVIISVINFCIRRNRIRNTENIEIPDGHISNNSNILTSVSSMISRRERANGSTTRRSNSVLYSTLQKAKRQMSREAADDDDYNDSLVMNEFDLPLSTPVQERKTYA